MNFSFLAVFLFSNIIRCDACASHGSSNARGSFLGTVEQGCTPGRITSVSQVVTDPSKCELPLGRGGCNLCKLRLYAPEKTTSRFLVQPLYTDPSTTTPSHVEAVRCKCSDGCYFHESSITQFGDFPLPNGLTTRGSFSEPFACFSEVSMPNEEKPTYTYLIWCEGDGGCPNPVVARYGFLIRFQLLSPNRPATKSTFGAKITSLPSSKCIVDNMNDSTKRFIRGDGGSQDTNTPVRSDAPERLITCFLKCLLKS